MSMVGCRLPCQSTPNPELFVHSRNVTPDTCAGACLAALTVRAAGIAAARTRRPGWRTSATTARGTARRVLPDRLPLTGGYITSDKTASAAAGARVDWPRLCQYGKESAALYRAYLSVCSVLDNSAHNGRPITRQIAAPITGSDGKPKRRKGGVIVRDPAA